jgi:hypothetical protein
MSFNILNTRTPAAGSFGAAGTPLIGVANGGAISVEDFIRLEGYTVEWSGVTTGTLHIESSINGTTWIQEGANKTADGRVTLTTDNVRFIRIRASVATTIAVLYSVSGRRGNAIV